MKVKIILLFLIIVQTSFAQSNVSFIVSQLPDLDGKQVGIRGNVAPLSWDQSLPLIEKDQQYQIDLTFSGDAKGVEFKFVLFDDNETLIWETNDNRVESLTPGESIRSEHQWNVEQLIDINNLPLLTPQELLADYQLVEKMVLDVHPGTYRYQNKAAIRQMLDELKEKFQKPLSHGEAYLAMSKVTAALKCDHTQVGFNNQKALINSIIHRQADKVPFAFEWINGKMVITHDATPENVFPIGAAILSINGVSNDQIREEMIKYIAADGATDKARMAKMSVEGFDFRYEPFDVFFPLLYPWEGALEVEVLGFGEQAKQSFSVSPQTREERFERLCERYPDFPRSRDDLWSLEITKDKVGILSLNSFGLFGWKAMTLDYKAFLADAFQRLKIEKVEHLIVDIRKNNGGNDEMKMELFTYFPINYKKAKNFEREGRTRYLQFPESLKPVVQTWGDNPWFFNLESDQRDEENIYYIFEEDQEKFPKTKSDAFKGEVYLLTSPANASLAFYLAADFKQKKLGTIIGQETGGNMRDINGGQILFLRLPNSQIEIDFPIMGGFSKGNPPNHGVMPDIEIIPSQEDIAKGRDQTMTYILSRIRS